MQRSTSDVRTRCIHTVKVGGHRLACFVVIIADTVLSNTHLSDKAFESACVRTRCIHMQNFGGHELAEVVISKAFRGGCVHATSPTAPGHQHERVSPCTNTKWTHATKLHQVLLLRHSSLVTISTRIAHRWLPRRFSQDVATHTHTKAHRLLMYTPIPSLRHATVHIRC